MGNRKNSLERIRPAESASADDMRQSGGSPTWMWLQLILLVGIVLRVTVWSINPFWKEPKEDSLQYHMMAQNLVEHGTYSTDEEPPVEPAARRVPGYPTFLAGVYAFSGPDARAAKAVQCFVDLGTIFLVFLLGWQIFGNRGVGLVAAAIIAVLPISVCHSNRLMTECLFGLLLLGLVGMAFRWRQTAGIASAVACGVLAGVLTLIKPEAGLLLVPLVVAVLLGAPRARGRLALQSLVAFSVLGLVVGVWLYRNHRVLGEVRLISFKEQRERPRLMRQYRLRYENGVTFRPERFTFLYGDNLDEAQERFDRAMESEVQNPDQSDIAFFITHPQGLLKMSAVRFAGLYCPHSWSETFGLDMTFDEDRKGALPLAKLAKGGLLAVDAMIVGIGLLGLLASLWPRNRAIWLVTGTVLYFTAVYSLLHANARYRAPLVPLLVLLGVALTVRLLTARRARQGVPASSADPEPILETAV